MKDGKTENKMEVAEVENKAHVTKEFGTRKFIIEEKTVNKCINLIEKIEVNMSGSGGIQEDAIVLLKEMQKEEYNGC